MSSKQNILKPWNVVNIHKYGIPVHMGTSKIVQAMRVNYKVIFVAAVSRLPWLVEWKIGQ